jgi:hypothetical protein
VSDSEFLVMGTLVSFKLREDGREIDAAAKSGLIYCAEGSAWPRCVLMVGPFRRGGAVEPDEISRAARKFLRTDDYEPNEGSFNAPAVNSSGWREVGELAKIWYLRQGALNYYLKHDFKKRQLWVFPVKSTLYRAGSWWKIQLPGTCIINERGLVSP